MKPIITAIMLAACSAMAQDTVRPRSLSIDIGEGLELRTNSLGIVTLNTVAARQSFDLCLSITTNWVRLENQWREVGIIVEETKASIVWGGKTNVLTLESKEVGTTGPRDVNRTNVVNFGTFTWTNIITDLSVTWPNATGGGK